MDISFFSGLPIQATAPVETVTPQGSAPEQQRQLIQAVRAVNAAQIFGEENELTFVLDRATRKALVRIVNRVTREVVRQIPAEYVIRIAEEYSRG